MNYKETFLAFSIGDINGISPELVLTAFQDELLYKHCNPVLFCHREVLDYYSDLLKVTIPEINIIKSWDDLRVGVLNLLPPSEKAPEIKPGEPSYESGKYAVNSLKNAIDAVMNGYVHNLVTLPIDKNNSHSEEFNYQGHTDFLGNVFEVDDYMMLLVSEEMRVGMVTGHIPISEVAGHINQSVIRTKLTVLQQCLQQDFGIRKPKIAVLGLNPHSGDDGLIGEEEKLIISPVMDEFINKGDLVYGPFPADGFFGKKLHNQYDAILAMYHDQGLIPFKQLSFSDGVNYTAGLPIVRTSPDHGTAFDIAGMGKASATSFINAIFELKKIYQNRIEYFEINKNPLPFAKHRREKFSIGVPNLK